MGPDEHRMDSFFLRKLTDIFPPTVTDLTIRCIIPPDQYDQLLLDPFRMEDGNVPLPHIKRLTLLDFNRGFHEEIARAFHWLFPDITHLTFDHCRASAFSVRYSNDEDYGYLFPSIWVRELAERPAGGLKSLCFRDCVTHWVLWGNMRHCRMPSLSFLEVMFTPDEDIRPKDREGPDGAWLSHWIEDEALKEPKLLPGWSPHQGPMGAVFYTNDLDRRRKENRRPTLLEAAISIRYPTERLHEMLPAFPDLTTLSLSLGRTEDPSMPSLPDITSAPRLVANICKTCRNLQLLDLTIFGLQPSDIETIVEVTRQLVIAKFSVQLPIDKSNKSSSSRPASVLVSAFGRLSHLEELELIICGHVMDDIHTYVKSQAQGYEKVLFEMVFPSHIDFDRLAERCTRLRRAQASLQRLAVLPNVTWTDTQTYSTRPLPPTNTRRTVFVLNEDNHLRPPRDSLY